MPGTSRRAGFAAFLVPLGVVVALAGVLSYGLDWMPLLAGHPGASAMLKHLVRHGLEASRYVAFGVPVLIAAGSLYRFVAARGSRGLVFLKLTAYVVLWAAGSVVLFFALFAAYFMGDEHAQLQLLVPTVLGIAGYVLIGAGLVASVLRTAPRS